MCHCQSGEVNSETSENQFFHSEFSILHYTQNPELKTSEFSLRQIKLGFPTPSFPFRTVPKSENLELKTRFPTLIFPFRTTLKTDNTELKTSEFSLRFTRTTILFVVDLSGIEVREIQIIQDKILSY